MADYETDRANALRLLVETAGLSVEEKKFLIFRPIVVQSFRFIELDALGPP
jgi:hypothetical protein